MSRVIVITCGTSVLSSACWTNIDDLGSFIDKSGTRADIRARNESVISSFIKKNSDPKSLVDIFERGPEFNHEVQRREQLLRLVF